MDGETQDIQALRVRPKLKNMDKISGSAQGAQLDDITTLTEVSPEILKTTLTAQAFTAYCKIPKTFLKTNIEKENFIPKYESLLAPGCAYSAEQVAIFGKKTLADAEGIHALNERMTTLMSAVAGFSLTVLSTSKPSTPGSIRSRRMRSGFSAAIISRADWPSLAVTSLKLNFANIFLIRRRLSGISSTASTRYFE